MEDEPDFSTPPNNQRENILPSRPGSQQESIEDLEREVEEEINQV